MNEVRKTREKLVEEAGGYDAYIKKLILRLKTPSFHRNRYQK
ncbi:MAG: hypothetical protein WA133_06985 [Syntrophales bacterium]